MSEQTILDLQEQMQNGAISSVKLTQGYLGRIESLDRNGPKLNAVIELNPDALEIATRMDAERAGGQTRGLLHGIPILIKDNIDTADRMTTTAGSLALAGWIAPKDAFLVGKLREAGAVLLGKTNLSEWANFRSSRSVSGWSSRGGQTRNPYALDRNPCGSSSGSAVAVSAGLCAAAIGTETDGSIICPSQANGIVGFKPTLGLVSRSGIIPIAHSQDTAGPMGRSVADAAVLLGALAGFDPEDVATAESQGKALSDYTPFLKKDGLQGSRLGVARNYFGFHPGVDAVMEQCLETLKAAGAILVETTELENVEKTGPTEMEVLCYEFKSDINAYLSKIGPGFPVHSLEELIAFNEQYADQVMPFFGQERALKAQEKGLLTEEAYTSALETNHRMARAEGIDMVLEKHQLDAIVAPSGSPAWLMDYCHGDYGFGGSSSPAAVAGYPNLTVPAGDVYGLPVGISFMGTAYSEPVLIRLAYAFEQARPARKAPKFRKRIVFRQPAR